MTSIHPLKNGNSLPVQASYRFESSDQFAHTMATLLPEPQKPVLTSETAKLLMFRSMTTGVPNWELDQFGGYDTVKQVFEANGGEYDIQTIPDELRRELAQKVSVSGVGNLLAAQIENLPIAASAIHALNHAGVDATVIEQLRSRGKAGADHLELTLIQHEPAVLSLVPAVEDTQPQSHNVVIQEQNTLVVELKQAIDDAKNNAVPYVDSASYLSSLFKA